MNDRGATSIHMAQVVCERMKFHCCMAIAAAEAKENMDWGYHNELTSIYGSTLAVLRTCLVENSTYGFSLQQRCLKHDKFNARTGKKELHEDAAALASLKQYARKLVGFDYSSHKGEHNVFINPY